MMPEDRKWEGPPEEFEALALEHFNVLYNTAVRLAQDPAEAEDLVQKTFLKVYRFFHRLEPGTNIKAWLFTILRNTYINAYRKAARQQPQVDFDQVAPFYAELSDEPKWINGSTKPLSL